MGFGFNPFNINSYTDPIKRAADEATDQLQGRSLELGTYSRPAVDALSKIDREALGGLLFGGVTYDTQRGTSADYNTDPGALRYMSPEQARMMAERDFINRTNATFNTVEHDPGTASNMGLWDYYNATGNMGDQFKAQQDAFAAQYQAPDFVDWGNLSGDIDEFGRISGATQRADTPWIYDVDTDKGRYSYIPSNFLTGVTGDRQAITVPGTTDADGNTTGGYTYDAPGQTALYLSGGDWDNARRVTLNPELMGGLNSMKYGDQTYDFLDPRFNQGFMFGPDADLSGLKMNIGEQNNSLNYPNVSGGMIGDVAPLVKMVGAGMMFVPGMQGIGAGLTMAGAGMDSAQNQALAQDLRARGYPVDSGDLHRGHALNAATAGLAYAMGPGGGGEAIKGFYAPGGASGLGLTGNALNVAAGATQGGLTGMGMGAVQDRENWLRGGMEGLGKGAVVGGGASYLGGMIGGYDAAGNPLNPATQQITSAAFGQELGKMYSEGPGKKYADTLARMYGNIGDQGDVAPTDLPSLWAGSGTNNDTNFDAPSIEMLQKEGYWDPSRVKGYVPNLTGQWDNATNLGFGLAGMGSRDDAVNAQTLATSDLTLNDAMYRYMRDQQKKGMGNLGMGGGSGGGGGIGGIGGLGAMNMSMTG